MTQTIDSLEFAAQGAHLDGTIAVEDMPRIHEHLNSPQGSVAWQLEGVPDLGGKPGLRIAVEGDIDLICQRCLGSYAFYIDGETLLTIERHGEAQRDDTESIAADTALDITALIEDEVLLALPMSPRHPDADCAGRPSVAVDDNIRPFAALAKLKTPEN